MPAGQENFPGRSIDRRHLPLNEAPQVIQAEAVVGREVVDRGLVVLRAGHDVQGECLAVAPAHGDDLLGVNLEQAGLRDRADGEGSLGAVEAQPRTRAAGDEDHANLARGQRAGADLGGPPPGHTLAVGLGQPHHLDRPHVVQVHVGGRLAAHQLADQPVQLGKVQAFQLAKQPRLLAGARSCHHASR